MASLICIGFFIGDLLGGAKLAVNISDLWLKKIFGLTMLILGIKMMISK